MKEAEALTRKLFENQTLYIPPTDDDVYKLKSELQRADSNLVIISYLDDKNVLMAQDEIFQRMLSRLPDFTFTSQIIYTNKNEVELSWLSLLTQTQKVLLCGMDLKHGDTTFPLNQNINRDQMQILPVNDITFIDLDPALKKAMWNEWMKQFSK